MADDIVTQVANIGTRLADVEEKLYGDVRAQRPGLMQEVRHLSKQLDRQVLIVWGLIVVSVLNIATVAMAVLL